MESCFENVMGRAWKIKEEKKNKKKQKIINVKLEIRWSYALCKNEVTINII